MYIVHMTFKDPTKWSSSREDESFSKILQAAEEMRAEYHDVPIKSIDIIDSKKPLEEPWCFQGFVVASLRVIK